MKGGKLTEEQKKTVAVINKMLKQWRERTGDDINELELLEMISSFFESLLFKGVQEKESRYKYKPQLFEEEPETGNRQKYKYLWQMFGELPEDEQQSIIQQVNARPEKFLLPMAKPVSFIFSGNPVLNDGEKVNLRVATKKTTDVIMSMQLAFPTDTETGVNTVLEKMGSTTRQVFNGFWTEIIAQARKKGAENISDINESLLQSCVVTTKQIAKAFTGIKGDVSKTMLKRVDAEMKKARTTLATMEFKDVAALYGYEEYNTALFYEFNIINADKCTIKSGGRIIEEAYRPLSISPLLLYAFMTDQIREIDMINLQTPINKTERNVNIQNYLLEYIYSLKNPKSKLKNSLYLNTLFLKAGIDPETLNRTQFSRLKLNVIIPCLTYWKEETGLLTNWKIEKGRDKKDKITFYVKLDT